MRVEAVDASDSFDVNRDTARRFAGEEVAFDEVERETVERVGGDEGGGDGVFGKDGETGADGAAEGEGSVRLDEREEKGKTHL